MKTKLTEEEKELMSYDDIAHVILKEKGHKMKIIDLFKIVAEELQLTEAEYENQIADFFELLSTDKRFIMLENGFWDLRVNHSHKIKIEDDEEDFIEDIDIEDDEEEQSEDDEDMGSDVDPEDDDVEDDLEGLAVITEDDEDDMM